MKKCQNKKGPCPNNYDTCTLKRDYIKRFIRKIEGVWKYPEMTPQVFLPNFNEKPDPICVPYRKPTTITIESYGVNADNLYIIAIINYTICKTNNKTNKEIKEKDVIIGTWDMITKEFLGTRGAFPENSPGFDDFARNDSIGKGVVKIIQVEDKLRFSYSGDNQDTAASFCTAAYLTKQ